MWVVLHTVDGTTYVFFNKKYMSSWKYVVSHSNNTFSSKVQHFLVLNLDKCGGPSIATVSSHQPIIYTVHCTYWVFYQETIQYHMQASNSLFCILNSIATTDKVFLSIFPDINEFILRDQKCKTRLYSFKTFSIFGLLIWRTGWWNKILYYPHILFR